MQPLIYFVRHGQTAWNAESRLQGQAETDITALGRTQADRNGARLRQLVGTPADFDFVASPMRRTRETMQRIRTVMGLDPLAFRTDARLIEVSFGDWQGRTFVELEAETPGITKPRSRDKWNFVPPGGESYQMLLQRVRPFLDAIAGPTVCVAHGGVMRAVFRHFGGVPEPQAATIEIHQDRILRLLEGRLDWL